MDKNFLVVVRSYTICFLLYQLFPERLDNVHLELYDIHIHHFNYGILINIVVCGFALFCSSPRARFWQSLFYGMGLFLIADEFIFWVTLSAEKDTGLARQSGNIFVFSVFLIVFIIRKIKNKNPSK